MSLAYHSYLFFAHKFAEIQKEQFQYLKTVKLKICHGRKVKFVVLYQVVTDPWRGLVVIFCGFISHLIGRETINIPEIFSGVHGFTGMTVIQFCTIYTMLYCPNVCTLLMKLVSITGCMKMVLFLL